MFYKKQNTTSPVFTISLCIILLGVGFLAGYVFTNATAAENYRQKELELNAQIAELSGSELPASAGNDPVKEPTPSSKPSASASSAPTGSEPPEPSQTSSGASGEDEPTGAPPATASPSEDPSGILIVNPDENEPNEPEVTDNPNASDEPVHSVGSSSDEPIPSNNPDAPNASEDPGKEKYIFMIYNDRLAIFDYRNDQVGEVQTIINTDLSFLSKVDRLMLEQGIIIENEEQLARILEDYTS